MRTQRLSPSIRINALHTELQVRGLAWKLVVGLLIRVRAAAIEAGYGQRLQLGLHTGNV